MLLLLLSFVLGPRYSQSQTPAQPTVIVVTLDGFPARALKDPHLPMPMLRALMKAGAVAEGGDQHEGDGEVSGRAVQLRPDGGIDGHEIRRRAMNRSCREVRESS